MIGDKEAELLKTMIENERRHWLRVIAYIKAGKSPYDIEWSWRGTEVGVDLATKDKKPWLRAAENLIDAGLAEWSEGARENNLLRLASDDTNRLELLVMTTAGLYNPARSNPPGTLEKLPEPPCKHENTGTHWDEGVKIISCKDCNQVLYRGAGGPDPNTDPAYGA